MLIKSKHSRSKKEKIAIKVSHKNGAEAIEAVIEMAETLKGAGIDVGPKMEKLIADVNPK